MSGLLLTHADPQAQQVRAELVEQNQVLLRMCGGGVGGAGGTTHHLLVACNTSSVVHSCTRLQVDDALEAGRSLWSGSARHSWGPRHGGGMRAVATQNCRLEPDNLQEMHARTHTCTHTYARTHSLAYPLQA